MSQTRLFVVNRYDQKEDINFEQILDRIKNLCALPEQLEKLKTTHSTKYNIYKNLAPLLNVDYSLIAQQTINGLFPGVRTSELDVFAAKKSRYLCFEQPEYGSLAARLIISNFEKNHICHLSQHFGIDEELVKNNLLLYTAKALYGNVDISGCRAPLIDPQTYRVILDNSNALNKMIDYNNDYKYDYNAFSKLESQYLQTCKLAHMEKRVPIERPQHLIMRVILGMHCCGKYNDYDKQRQNDAEIWREIKDLVRPLIAGFTYDKIVKQVATNSYKWDNLIQTLENQNIVESEDDISTKNVLVQKIKDLIVKHTITWDELLDKFSGDIGADVMAEIQETYELMSDLSFTPATPTLFNCGTLRPQLSSCFLIMLPYDDMDGITKFWKICARISKFSGGIGSSVHIIRCKNSYIRSTNGTSNGLVLMLKVVNDESVYVDQCLAPDTVVYTLTGTKRIADVQIGEQLLNRHGEFQIIKDIFQNQFNGKMMRIKTAYSEVSITESHPVMCVENDFNYGVDDLLLRLTAGWIEPNFIPAGKLTKNHYIAFPKITYEQDISMYDNDDCYMYGMMLKAGLISHDDMDYRIAYNNQTKPIIENYLRSKNTKYMTEKPPLLTLFKNLSIISWNKNTHIKFNHAMLYNDKENSRIHANILYLPKEKLQYVLRGYNDAVNTNWGDNSQLVEDIKFIKFRCSELNDPSTFEHDGMIYVKISNIDVVNFNGVVTDFEMDGTADYLTNLGLVHNGGGKRPGSHAIYLEPWHADIIDVVNMKRPRGNESTQGKNLFYAIWMNDEFMRTMKYESQLEKALQKKGVKADQITERCKLWHLMCPDMSPGLADTYDVKLRMKYIKDAELSDPAIKKAFPFTSKYREYIKQGKYIAKVSARETFMHILDIIMETGVPYMVCKDASNRKNNQKNLGTIKSSNLCVAPETKLLTDLGYLPISDLKDQTVNVWNGVSWSPTTVRQTGFSELITVRFSDNTELICTRYHKFVIKNELGEYQLAAEDLKPHMQLIEARSPHCMIGTDISSGHDVQISSVVITNRTDNTFCVHEPKLQRAVFNGVLTGNCAEILQYSSPEEIAVCNLHSIGLCNMLTDIQRPENAKYKYFSGWDTNIKNVVAPNSAPKQIKYFDWFKFAKVIRRCVRNIERVITINYYPVKQAKYSNLRHRPMGLGIQDLANLYTILRMAFDSVSARELNFYIFEFLYYIALDESSNISAEVRLKKLTKYTKLQTTGKINAKQLDKLAYLIFNTNSGSYKSYIGSPISNGIFEWDMWVQEQQDLEHDPIMFVMQMDWQTLRDKIKVQGMRHSKLIALMPTVSTSEIMGNSPCIEPHNGLILKTKKKKEEIVVNRLLSADMIDLGMWNQKIRNEIMKSEKGSIQECHNIPKSVRDIYKISWDLSMADMIELYLSRAPFIDQSQSFNWFIAKPSINELSKYYMYMWKRGATTMSYYNRRLAVADANKTQIVDDEIDEKQAETEPLVCYPGCNSCGA